MENILQMIDEDYKPVIFTICLDCNQKSSDECREECHKRKRVRCVNNMRII